MEMAATRVEELGRRIPKVVPVDIEVMTRKKEQGEENAVSPVLKPSRKVV